tara:strand:+ start:912 stop:1343 length:432 start_codon:yes stop_codon:yes gene_type:complete
MAIYNNIQITIDLNELVQTRGEFLFKDSEDSGMSENQIQYIAERLRTTLTWDSIYHMVDTSILEFYDCHEHPEIWDPHYGEIQPEPGREAELVAQEKARKQFKKEFKMVTIENSAWSLDVPVRRDRLQSGTEDDAEDEKNGII